MLKLNFGKANSKLVRLELALSRKVFTFSVLSGFACPYAKDCLSMAVLGEDGRYHIEDGPDTQWRCFSASEEALFPNVYKSRAHNMGLIELAAKSVKDACNTIIANIPKKAGIIRIHVGGDFKTKAYMQSWIAAAQQRPDVLFYAYTKSLPFWVALKDSIPNNLIMTASYGGHKDELIAKHNLRYARVVFSEAEAYNVKLPIDHDDSHAANPLLRDNSFALLIHGAQPKGSEAGKAVRKLNGLGAYGKKGRVA